MTRDPNGSPWTFGGWDGNWNFLNFQTLPWLTRSSALCNIHDAAGFQRLCYKCLFKKMFSYMKIQKKNHVLNLKNLPFFSFLFQSAHCQLRWVNFPFAHKEPADLGGEGLVQPVLKSSGFPFLGSLLHKGMWGSHICSGAKSFLPPWTGLKLSLISVVIILYSSHSQIFI